jgi:lipopolysaccharide export system protein LptA
MKTVTSWIATVWAVGLTLGLAAGFAQAEKADRTKPMVVEADQPGTLDLQSQVVVFNGNVRITQGTLSLRAESVEVRESRDGQRSATAVGASGKPASYRQKRDDLDEWVEGSADRIEYDTRSDTLKLSGNASVRRLRGSTVADEISGGSIVWDNAAGVFTVSGGAVTPANPGGRIRAVLAPRSAPAASGAGETTPLKPSRSLGGDGR